MKKVASGLFPIILLNRKSGKPLHRQLYESFRAAVLRGILKAGDKVPSSRCLASELRISRIPVLTAYAQLLAEGYFEGRRGSGTYVASGVPRQWRFEESDRSTTPEPPAARRVSRRSGKVPAFKQRPWVNRSGAFVVGTVSGEDFPSQVWASLTNRHVRRMSVHSLHYGDPLGLETLRTTIADYLRRTRALNCDASQIMVVSGSQQGLDLCGRVLLNPGDRVWLEEPGYRLARHVFALAGCLLVPVPVDSEGMQVSEGISRYRKARAAFVTPSHQFPLGCTMSASRRLQLLDWAHRSGSWIIEDDYDNEYRYESMPISSLQGLDRGSRVIYIGTFSKTLFPSLRIGYLVIPHDLVARFVSVRLAMDVYPPRLYQEVLNDFMGEGHFARHIRRMRLLYSQRRSALVESIREEFGDTMKLLGAEAGMHVVATLENGRKDRSISERAALKNLWLWPLSSSYLQEPAGQGFILGFGSVTPRQVPNAVRRLRGVIEDC